MLKHHTLPRIALRLTLLAVFAGLTLVATAQEGTVKSPESKHAADLAVRKAGQAKFDKDTKKFGVELYLDPNSNKWLAISETGFLAVQPTGPYAEAKDKAPESKYGHDLRIRKAGQGNFDKDTKKWGTEAFQDPHTNSMIYISETGSIAIPSAAPFKDAMGKEADWKYALELPVRKANEKVFGMDTKKYGVEVFVDPNTNYLIYATEVASLAVVPGKATVAGKVKDPERKEGLRLSVRKAGQKDFNPETTKDYGLEIYQDPNSGNVVFISDTGSIAVLPGATYNDTLKAKGADWKYGLDIKVRKAGQPEFGAENAKFGVEVFQHDATSSLIFISETGAVAVVPVK
jgi:hypothetical protein